MLYFFTRNGLDYALIGGVALNAYGRARQTDDIDFLLLHELEGWRGNPVIDFERDVKMTPEDIEIQNRLKLHG